MDAYQNLIRGDKVPLAYNIYTIIVLLSTCMNRFGNRRFYKAIKAHISCHGGNNSLLMQLRRNTHIEVALVCFFRFRTGLRTQIQIIIYLNAVVCLSDYAKQTP